MSSTTTTRSVPASGDKALGERPPRPVRRTRRRIARRAGWWIAMVLMLIGCLIWIYPFLWMVSASLKSTIEIFGSGLNLIPKQWQWANYAEAWVQAGFGRYLLNTFIVTIATVVIVVVRCAMAGYVLGRFSFKGRKIIMAILVATIFVPVGYTIIPVVDITMRLGLLNSLAGMIVAMSGGAQVASILLYAGFFHGIPRELEEAAIIDGAGFWAIFRRVMWPLAKPVTATVTLLTFLGTWNAFFLPLVFTLSRPDLRTVSVGMMAFVSERSTDWAGMAAAATISLLPIVILFIVLQRHFIEGIAGAVKQ